MALITCPDCGKEISDAAPACPHCGRPKNIEQVTPISVEERKDLHQPENVAVCPSCMKPNWQDSEKCYFCGHTLINNASNIYSERNDGLSEFIDISDSLSPAVKSRLLTNEPALAYVPPHVANGCGTIPNSSDLLITDSRVLMDNQVKGGCTGTKTVSSKHVDVPIRQISSVSMSEIKSGCGSAPLKGITVKSGTADLGTASSKNSKEIEGALRILQALIRAVGK
ncbi:MAG TPA: zinc ribbon domain-containing protein [bacterium]|nr:zinc ribbon domain-containing protein [bacterium]